MSNDILDLRPLLAMKKRAQCAHRHTTVDAELAELTCDECEADLDPWWYIRRLATEDHSRAAYYAEQRKRYEEWEVETRARHQKLVDDVNALAREKERLLNTEVNGVRVGASLRRRRKTP